MEQRKHYTVVIRETGESYRCQDQESLLSGMARLGRKGIPVGCCGGGCGICKVEMLSGDYASRPMSREHISAGEEAAGVVLACRVYPRSDVTLRVVGKMEKACSGPACRPQLDAVQSGAVFTALPESSPKARQKAATVTGNFEWQLRATTKEET